MDDNASEYLKRIAEALERMAPAVATAPDWSAADAFVWQPHAAVLRPVTQVAALPLEWLKGIDHIKQLLLQNTQQFAQGHAANHALLWGARGMGKSSLVKAVHAHVNQQTPGALALVELLREDIETLPQLLDLLKDAPRRFILYCDDLSFEGSDSSYQSLKTVLDGGVEQRTNHVLFYATSNRRHLMPREMIENEQSQAVHPSEVIEDKLSLSDRFGLWLGFHRCDQATYLAMVQGYVDALGLAIEPAQWRAEALEWSATRGSRSGRVAWHYIQDVAGRLGSTDIR